MSDLQRWLPGHAFFWILLMISVGFQIARLDVSVVELPAQMGTVLFGLLLVIAIINGASIRFLVLPRAMAEAEPRRNQLVLISYMFAVAPATYGLVVSLFTGKSLLILPFAVVALFGLFINWSYLRHAAIA